MSSPPSARRAVPRRSGGRATRKALLDATIDVLVDRGYAGLTTTLVCERAGVTRGAQAHYFATKADLVVQALEPPHRCAWSPTWSSTPLDVADDPAGQYAVLLDRLWEIFTGPVSPAQLELFVAARTDPDLHRHLVQFDAGGDRHAGRRRPPGRPPAGRAARVRLGDDDRDRHHPRPADAARGGQRARPYAGAWSPARDQLLAGLPSTAAAES